MIDRAEQARIRLIQQLCHLPADRLIEVQRLFDGFERGEVAGGSRRESGGASPHFAGSPHFKKLKMESGAGPPHSKKGKMESGDRSPPSKGASSKDWPHAPSHRMSEHGTYIVTGGTLYKEHIFRGAERLELLENKLLTLAKQYHWQLEAWAVFSNHYHFVAHSLANSSQLGQWLNHLHSESAREVNELDDNAGRTVWFNFWDRQLTYERSYLARLNYVHQNAVWHGLVSVANQYPWCSAAWFERTATPAQVKTIYGFKTDKIRVIDNFKVVW